MKTLLDFQASDIASEAETHGKTHEIPVAGKYVLEFHASSVRLRLRRMVRRMISVAENDDFYLKILPENPCV